MPGSFSEQNVRLAARMYEMRDAAKKISRNYSSDIKVWIDIVHAAAIRHKCEPIAVVPRIDRVARAAGKPLGDADIMWLTAAVVEICEGMED